MFEQIILRFLWAEEDFAHGTSLLSQIEEASTQGHTAFAYTSNARTLHIDRYRFTLHKDRNIELYDHTSYEKETKNLAKVLPGKVENRREVFLGKTAYEKEEEKNWTKTAKQYALELDSSN